MALTQAEFNSLKQEIKQWLQSESVGVGDLTLVSALTGINSLPAMRGTEVVLAPISLLSAPATTAATTANNAATAANTARDRANTAAAAAESASAEASRAASLASGVVTDFENVKSGLETKIAEAQVLIPVFNVNDRCGDTTYTLNTALAAIASKALADQVVYMKKGMIITYKVKTEKWEAKQFTGSTFDEWTTESKWTNFGSGGSGGGFYNISLLHPLSSGYYTKETAVAALADADIKDEDKPGMIITFEVSPGRWEDYRFAGIAPDFLKAASWTEFGVKDVVKAITLNGVKILPDADGNITMAINIPEIDETLDGESTNPVQNKAVKVKLDEIEASTVYGFEAEVDEETNMVRLILTNKSGAEIASVEYPGGSGSGSGESDSATKIVINSSVNNAVIKEGGNAELSYFFAHQYSSGDDKGTSTGQKATILITMTRGAQTIYSQTINDVSEGSYALDISKYLFLGTTDIYVKATVRDIEGKTQTKQSWTSVRVVTLSLASSYSLTSHISGYASNAVVDVPFTISGTGTKTVSLYVDGIQKDTKTVSQSGTTNGNFSFLLTPYTVGRHTVQMVAELEPTPGLIMRSDSVYFDIYKTGSSTPSIATKLSFPDGRIFTSEHKTPRIEVGQYEKMVFDFTVYDPGKTTADMTIFRNGILSQSVSIPRTTQVYSNRFTEQGEFAMNFVCGAFEYPFYIDVIESPVAVSEATQGLLVKLSAAGRSNEEANPAVWTSGDVQTIFENVDWQSSGWIDDSLRLRNGAKAMIDYRPFETDVASTGATIEIDFKVSNVLDRDANIITCMSGTKGFQITAEEASMYTGSTKQVTDDDGNTVTSKVGVGMRFASDLNLKVAFVIGKRTDGRKIELYINGGRSKADIYSEADNFIQENPEMITIDSSFADVEISSLRIYNRAISDDEELGNRIVDSRTSEEMALLFEKNDVLTEDGKQIDIDKLLKKGKGVIRVVRTGGLQPINAENNKSTDFLGDVYIYTPWGDEIVLKNIYIRIQGTSSTKYPRKNYRFYCAKGVNPEVWINGVLQDKNELPIMPGDIPVKVLCAKCDYSDSSMTHNTGIAKLYNDIMKELDLLTPPQEIDDTIRSSINGVAYDMFDSETIDGQANYCGQYNLNNDKSNWEKVTGMKGVPGIDEEKVICLEFLNNSERLGLFQVDANIDAQFDSEFEDALEFNWPKDTLWSSANTSDGEVNANAYQKTAITRLWSWIRDCIPAGADTTNYKNISSFVSQKFKDEVANYFPVNHLCTWYLFTDYFALVDQRVKNMIARTWDGLIWYLTYYDGDTALLGRNDSFLAYLYTLGRETWDDEKSKYAYEGHNSWLWCLVLANLETELKACASALREKLTTDRVLQVLNEEQQGNWCERIYNKSGEFKYIIPQTEGVIVKGELTKYPYIYALQGSREAHRTHTVKNRFALLDARWETGAFTSDNIDMYMSRASTDTANTIDVVANEIYYFGYGTNNAPSIQPSQEAEEGETVRLIFERAFSMNDPIRVYGASRIRELDMRGSANNVTGDLNLNKCTVLRKLNLRSTGEGSKGWCLVLDKCTQLREIDLNRQKGARTGTLSSTELNFSNQTRLEKMDAGRTEIQSAVFAEGSPLTTLVLPATLTTLRLEYLPLLAEGGLTIEGFGNIETFRFSNCPNLNWKNLLPRCTNVKRIRIVGIDETGDGSLLETYKNTGGVDVAGNAVSTCSLVGTYRLTRYLPEETYEAYKAHYPELNIIQPEYTMIEFDDSISDDYNVTNLDNNTGYNTGTDYIPSAHILRIMAQRYRCLGKQAEKGTMTIYPLHDNNSNFFADYENLAGCSPADLDGSQGDVMMYEPEYWYKGINDYLNEKKYSCYSSNREMPAVPNPELVQIMTLDDIKVDARNFRERYKLLTGFTTIASSYSSDTNYSVCKIDVSGHKKVRFPTVVGTNLVCSLFATDGDDVAEQIIVPSLNSKFENGMYIIADVPDNAKYLYFTIHNNADFDYVVLSNSDRIEDMEPEWVKHEECLVGVFEANAIGSKLYSAITGGTSIANLSKADMELYANQRNLQLIDYEMHKDVANLFFATYGRRDAQDQCGYGQNTNARVTGLTAMLGMKDTINQNHAVEYSWYETTNEYGEKSVVRINSSNCLGYENWFGNKAEWMGKVSLPNTPTSEQLKWYIEMPDGSIRKVKSLNSNGGYYAGTHHQKYMDIIFVGTAPASTTTHYCDYFGATTAASRVVYRSYNSANAHGGVSCSHAYYDASYTSPSIGSRLAFRGKIERAVSVAAYKALKSVA